MHIERSTTIRLPLPPTEALSLFTPEGEREWVPGWDPEPLHAPGGSLSVESAVFRTTHGGEETVWLVIRVDAEVGAADYVRITPSDRVGTVGVRIRDDNAGGSFIDVRYRLTALSPAGESRLAEITPEAFETEIRGWRAAIDRLR